MSFKFDQDKGPDMLPYHIFLSLLLKNFIFQKRIFNFVNFKSNFIETEIYKWFFFKVKWYYTYFLLILRLFS